jgi:hypothetical protein
MNTDACGGELSHLEIEPDEMQNKPEGQEGQKSR